MPHSLDAPTIDIELTNLCQTACLMCPRDEIKKRGLGIMKPETFECIVKECKKYRTKLIAFCGLGESLLNKNIFDYIKLVKQEVKGIKIDLITNGALLTFDVMQKLIMGNVDKISISVQAYDPKLYSILMPGLEYNQVIKNIHSAFAIAPPWMNMSINITVHKMNEHELDIFRNYWQRYTRVIYIPIHTRGGYMTDERLIDPIIKNIITTRCKIFEGINFISWDGRILSCCHDVHGKNEIGHIHNNTFDDIKKNKIKIIKEIKWFPICSKCTDALRNNLF